MVVVDQAGTIVIANSQTEKLFGYHQKEILGPTVEVLIPERFRERHRGNRGKFSAEPRVRPMGAKPELFGLRKDGTEFPVEISLSPVETATGILITSAIRDITERKLAEQELAKANERLHLAMEAGSAGGWDYDLKTGKDVWIGTAHAQLGMTPDETSGSRKEFWVAYIRTTANVWSRHCK
jgi:protein-histidine pros-kinase